MDKIIIGTIAKPQGIRGELKIIPITKDISRFENLKEIYLGDEKSKRIVRGCRLGFDTVFMYIDGIISRNDAEKVRGALLLIDRENALLLSENEYFITDIIGCKIYNEEGCFLGAVDEVLNFGAADIYTVKGGEKEFSMPFVNGLTKMVDVKSKKIIINNKRFEEVVCYED